MILQLRGIEPLAQLFIRLRIVFENINVDG